MKIEIKQNRKAQLWVPIARKTALISGIFIVLLSTLILINYFQTQSIDPLNNKAPKSA